MSNQGKLQKGWSVRVDDDLLERYHRALKREDPELNTSSDVRRYIRGRTEELEAKHGIKVTS